MNTENIKKLIKSKRLEKSWETAFNEYCFEAEEELLDYICEHIEFKDSLLNDLYVQAYQIKSKIDNIDVINIDIEEGMTEINSLNDKFKVLEDEYYKNAFKVTQNYLMTAFKIKELGNKVLKSAFHLTSEKDKLLLTKKHINFSKKLANIATSFDYEDVMETDEIFKYLREDIEKIISILEKRQAKQSKEALKELEEMKKERQKHSKIFNYKDMVSYAIKNNCEQVRVSGDHLIFRNKLTGIAFPIPAHSLGIGLQQKIKRQVIESNKVD